MRVYDYRSPKGRLVGARAPYGDRDHSSALSDGIHVLALDRAVPPALEAKAEARP
jgi:hypothetical protein